MSVLGGAAISWISKNQSLVALSKEEAEYTAFTEASRDILWIRQLLADIHARFDTAVISRENRNSAFSNSPDAPLPATTIYADNQAAVNHAKSEGVSARTKHFDIRLHHSRDMQKNGTVDFVYIRSAENSADIFTKPLPLDAHRRHRMGIGLETETEEMGINVSEETSC